MDGPGRASQSAGRILKRYFELSKESPALSIDFSKGRISPYDRFFRQYANEIGWDWRMLAVQGYTESRFDSTAVSWAGARGVMQIMPRTGSTPRSILIQNHKSEANIRTAAAIMKALDNLVKKVPDSEERRKFILAAYNSGIAHIYDATALAKNTEKKPKIWDGKRSRCSTHEG